MDMSGEFINVYIEKMRAVISEMQSKLLLLETDLHFKTKKVEELQTALNSAVAKAQKPNKKVTEESF
jgi:Tat protein secretion system quality control protein TatD with DNase activity